jgi:hypothetical protein
MQNATQVADYIASLCGELAEMAGKSKLHALQRMLSQVQQMAGQTAQGYPAEGNAVTGGPQKAARGRA